MEFLTSIKTAISSVPGQLQSIQDNITAIAQKLPNASDAIASSDAFNQMSDLIKDLMANAQSHETMITGLLAAILLGIVALLSISISRSLRERNAAKIAIHVIPTEVLIDSLKTQIHEEAVAVTENTIAQAAEPVEEQFTEAVEDIKVVEPELLDRLVQKVDETIQSLVSLGKKEDQSTEGSTAIA